MLSDEQLRNLPVVGSSACADEIDRLRQSLAEAEEKEDRAEAAYFTEMEKAQAKLRDTERERDAAQASSLAYKLACKNSLKLPRPWMDGGLSYEEWNEAFERIEKVIDSPNPGQPLLYRLHAQEERIRLLEAALRHEIQRNHNPSACSACEDASNCLAAVPKEPQKVVEPKA